MANYHYTGREIRALTEVLGAGTKGGQCCALARGPKMVTEHLENGGVWGGRLTGFFFLLVSFYYFL